MDVYLLIFSVSFDGSDTKFSLIVKINVLIQKYDQLKNIKHQ
jgi:hypothetical protein